MLVACDPDPSDDVALIVGHSRVTCHQEGGMTPFALDSYAAAVARHPGQLGVTYAFTMTVWSANLHMHLVAGGDRRRDVPVVPVRYGRG